MHLNTNTLICHSGLTPHKICLQHDLVAGKGHSAAVSGLHFSLSKNLLSWLSNQWPQSSTKWEGVEMCEYRMSHRVSNKRPDWSPQIQLS